MKQYKVQYTRLKRNRYIVTIFTILSKVGSDEIKTQKATILVKKC